MPLIKDLLRVMQLGQGDKQGTLVVSVFEFLMASKLL